MEIKIKSAGTVACPYCGVPPFNYCKSKSGKSLSQYHSKRRMVVSVLIKQTTSQADIRERIRRAGRVLARF